MRIPGIPRMLLSLSAALLLASPVAASPPENHILLSAPAHEQSDKRPSRAVYHPPADPQAQWHRLRGGASSGALKVAKVYSGPPRKAPFSHSAALAPEPRSQTNTDLSTGASMSLCRSPTRMPGQWSHCSRHDTTGR